MIKASIGIVAALLLSGCQLGSVSTAETRNETQSIELGQVKTARVTIRMGVGELRVAGGTPKLLEADFAYNVPEWRPVIDYRVSPAGADLTISQPDAGASFGNTVYRWDLRLNSELPVDVAADLGAGEATLELGRMNLRSVDVKVGVGEVNVDLRGEPKQGYNVRVEGGVGEVTVYLPRDAGISAKAAGGIGGVSTTGLEERNGVWINPDRVDAPVTIQLDVKGAVGEINLIR